MAQRRLWELLWLFLLIILCLIPEMLSNDVYTALQRFFVE